MAQFPFRQPTDYFVYRRLDNVFINKHMSEDEIITLSGLTADSPCVEMRHRRQSFYHSVLSTALRDPGKDLTALCDAWKTFTGAKWTWLWLFHPESNTDEGHWELSAVDSAGASKFVLNSLTPDEGNKTVAELAASAGFPILVNKIKTWEKVYRDRSYKVVCYSELQQMGCSSLLCVPLTPPPDGISPPNLPTARFGQPLRATICAHFESDPPKMEGRLSLSLMGELSAWFIRNVFDAEQRVIISELNSMSLEYLTRKSKQKPADDRREYLNKVISLIVSRLKIEYSSVFYRNQNKKFISCIATNSLFDEDGAPLMDDERKFRNAIYRRGEGLTGEVFKSGKPYFSRIGHSPGREKYKFRETPMEMPETELAWVIYPIYAPAMPGARNSRPEILGVIRCIGTRARFGGNQRRNIDPLQIQTLDFVVKMIAPVLETLAANIERERVISIIKHDLFAPLKMCRDLVRRTNTKLIAGKIPDEHFVPDMTFCLHTAETLVAGLDSLPTQVKVFSPRETKMEADIVAGIRNMLANYARLENNMSILMGDIKGVFPGAMVVDRDLISRALTNLIVNAIKYGQSGSIITISARSDQDNIYLLVQNKGLCIREEDKERIFEEEYRSEEAIQKKVGLGMGLPIAKAIMRRHGGDLKLMPSSDSTVFAMIFPWHLAVEDAKYS